MYETHYPGFCYTRSGEQKNLPKIETTISLEFEHVRSLIFTDEEVDLEKILCLHLLCAHKTETLTPPKKKVRHTCREHSPTERLIERSKRGFTNYERLYKILPLFNLELVDQRSIGEKPTVLINDGRLASRILINEKLMTLINTVVTALEKTNHEKFEHLLALGNDPSFMRKMLENECMAEFLDSIFDHQLVNCCEFFVLTPPFKIKIQDLNVKTSHGNLEHLVTHFRQNVLQQTPRILTQDEMEEEAKKELELLPKTYTISLPKPSKIESKKAEDTSSNSSMTKLDTILTESSKLSTKSSTKRSIEEERPLGIHTRINFIARNKKAAGKTKRIEYDFDDDDSNFIPRKKSSVSSDRSRVKSLEPVIVVKTAPEPIDEEKETTEETFVETIEGDGVEETESDSPASEEKPKPRRHVWERPELSSHIKHTTCPACMERWKTPLPSPKTPRVRKEDVLPELYADSLRTNSHHRISMMINKAMYKLQSYDRRYSPDSENSRRSPTKKKEVEDDNMDNVYLNPMDLAKIEQEIKEREAQKKLEKFLGRYSNKKDDKNNK